MLAGGEDTLRGGLDDLFGDLLDADDVQVLARQQLVDGGDGEDAVQGLGEHLLDAALARVVHLEAQQGGHLLQIVLDPVVHLLDDRRFDQQFGVFDGDGGVVTKRGQQRDLFLREVMRSFRVTVQDPDLFALDNQRHGGHRGQTLFAGDLRAGIFLGVF